MTYTNSITDDLSNYPSSGHNPEVIIGSDLPIPAPVSWPRKVYTRKQYSPLSKFTYSSADPQEKDVFLSASNDTYKSEDAIFFYRMDNIYRSADNAPSFITKENFTEVFSKLPVGFLTPQMSILPKVLVPSQNIIDNGLKDSITGGGVFEWVTDKYAGIQTTIHDSQKMIVLEKFDTSKTERKIDLLPENVSVITKKDDVDESKFIGGGAFQMVISFLGLDMPSKETKSLGSWSDDGTGGSYSDNKTQAYVTIELGSLMLNISSDGTCMARWTSGECNSEILNLVSGPGEECIPQAKLCQESGNNKTYVISVYPCWNGVVLQSGIQNGKNIVGASSVYLKKNKNASIWKFCKHYPINNGAQKVPFDPQNPAPVIVETISTTGDKMDAIPDLGDSSSVLHFKAFYCSCAVAYAPLFFNKVIKFDHVMRGNANVTGYTYAYKMYPVWTANGTDYKITDGDSIVFNSMGETGDVEFTNFYKANININTNSGKFPRTSAEIFGCIIEMSETKEASETPSAQAYANGISNWEDFITRVSLKQNLDSSDGSLTFDKFGATGSQDAALTQNVGKITVSVKGGYNTNGNETMDDSTSLLFKGYSWCAGEDKSTSGADVNLTLVGVEKRLEDVNLVSPPIFDGYTFGTVVQYLCGEAGVSYTFSAGASPSTPLLMSSDQNVAIYNWTTGMDVKSALDQICKDTAHRYTPIDGKLLFYGLNSDGSPNYTGTTWSGFDGTKITSFNTNPDFDNIRNKIFLISMRKTVNASDAKFHEDFPIYPLTTLRKNATSPEIPWSKGICFTVPGYMEQAELDQIGDNIQKVTKKYELLGGTTIPGANIKVLDNFLGYVVTDVSHDIDLVNKTWTTTLGFMNK